MKRTLIILIVGLMAVGCGTPAENTTKAKSVEELRKSVAGTYVHNTDPREDGGNTVRLVFLEDSIGAGYINGRKVNENKWKIAKGELHILSRPAKLGEQFRITVYRINKDSSITVIASIQNGVRVTRPKRDQNTFKKIK